MVGKLPVDVVLLQCRQSPYSQHYNCDEMLMQQRVAQLSCAWRPVLTVQDGRSRVASFASRSACFRSRYARQVSPGRDTCTLAAGDSHMSGGCVDMSGM